MIRAIHTELRVEWGGAPIEVRADPGRGIPGPRYDRGCETRVTQKCWYTTTAPPSMAAGARGGGAAGSPRHRRTD
eukprot:79657-Prorocentrum_minimum.AAC.1